MLSNTAPLPETQSAPLHPTLSTIYFPGSRRRNGKIAKLSKELRHLVNTMLEDGHTYSEIIDKLTERGISAKHENISNWKDGGYQDWLNEQAWRETMLLRHESLTDILAGTDPVKLPEAGLQIATLGLCELLRSLSEPGTEADPDKYVRVANSLARLSRSVLQLQQYRDAAAKTKAAELKQRDPTKPGTPKEQQLLIDNWTAFFGHDFGPGGYKPENDPGRVGSPQPTVGNSEQGRVASPQATVGNSEEPTIGPSAAQNTPDDSVAQPPTTQITPEPATATPAEPSPSPANLADGSGNLSPAQILGEQTHCAECGEFIGRPTPSGYRPTAFCPRCRTPIPDQQQL